VKFELSKSISYTSFLFIILFLCFIVDITFAIFVYSTFPNPQAQSGSTLPPNSENNASSKSSPPQPPRLHQHHHQHHRGGFHGAKHQLAHRAREKISMKFAEKMVSNVLPRLVKRTGKHLGPRIILTKLGRGLAIAIPGIVYWSNYRFDKQMS